MIFNPASTIREGIVQIAIKARALQPPFLQRVDDQRRQGNSALARIALGHPYLVIAVRPLPHVQASLIKFYILPPQPAQLGGSQPGEDRGDQQWPPSAQCCLDNGADFLARRNIHADLRSPPVASLILRS